MADSDIRLGFKTTAELNSLPNRVLKNGQHVYVSDGIGVMKEAHKIGDGVTILASLPWRGIKADLVGGLVPSSQLPSYVDDVLEYANVTALPVTGEGGKIYITLNDNHQHRWSGSSYIDITGIGSAVWGGISGIFTDQTDAINYIATNYRNRTKEHYITFEDFGAVGDGIANDSTAITNAVANAVSTGKAIWVGGKDYRITSTIVIPSGVKIFGNGYNSIISIDSNIKILDVQGSNNQFIGLRIKSVTSTIGGAQFGITATGSSTLVGGEYPTQYVNNLIHGCYFDKLKAGFHHEYIVGTYHQGAFKVSDCFFFGCENGVFSFVRGEYVTFSNNSIFNCTYGYNMWGGNNSIVGGQVTDCGTAILFNAASNDTHCKAIGVKFNHNTLLMSGTHALAWSFDSCALYANGISNTSAGENIFNNCEIGMAGETWTMTNSPVYMNNCNFATLPSTHALTGTPPVMVNCRIGASLLATPTQTVNQASTFTTATTITPLAYHNFIRITAQSTALTIVNQSYTPIDRRELQIIIKDNGTARVLTWGTNYTGALPTTTIVGVDLVVNLRYNAVTAKYEYEAVSIQNASGSQDGQLLSTDWNNFNNKQAQLVSGTNIKTINSQSLLGSGDIVISGGGGGGGGSTLPQLLAANGYTMRSANDKAYMSFQNTQLLFGFDEFDDVSYGVMYVRPDNAKFLHSIEFQFEAPVVKFNNQNANSLMALGGAREIVAPTLDGLSLASNVLKTDSRYLHRDFVPKTAFTSTTQGIIKTILITGGSFSIPTKLTVNCAIQKNNIGTYTHRMYVNTTDDLTGSPVLIWLNTAPPTTMGARFRRTLTIRSSTDTFTLGSVSQVINELITATVTTVGVSNNINWATNKYLIITGQYDVAGGNCVLIDNEVALNIN